MKGPVYLIGYMATGKSFLGKVAAKRLEMEFLDLDDAIKELANKSIRRIFEEDGEETFRQIESKALRNLTGFSNNIIATGGGTPCFGENMKYMNNTGYTILLDTPVSIIKQRLLESSRIRPLVDQIPEEKLAPFIHAHLGKRLSFYRQAKYQIQIGEDRDTNINSIVKLIQKIHACNSTDVDY